MELIKKNIHMERGKCRATTQITLEEDVNISDQKEDALRIITEKGSITVEELRPASDYVIVKGYLWYEILYLTDDASKNPCCLEGKLPFEEKVHMEGVTANDSVLIHSQLEDISVGLINSRKFSIRALLFLTLSVEELYDEEAVLEVVHDEPLEIQKKDMDITTLSVDTKDIFRIKEEIDIPSGMPNIFALVWKDISICNLSFQPMNNQISMTGELQGFFLYESEGEAAQIRFYEMNRPFNGVIEVDGCREDMTLNMEYEISHADVEIRPDADGEERTLMIEAAMNLSIKLYETQNIPVVTDVYGIINEAEPVRRESSTKSLLQHTNGKLKIEDTLKINEQGAHILQLCHTDGQLFLESQETVEDAVLVSGVIQSKSLYITGDDDNPYACISGAVPFEYRVEVMGIKPQDQVMVTPRLDQIGASMTDGEEIEVKAVLSFDVMVFTWEKDPLIDDIVIKEIDYDKRSELPGMAVYIARETENIWDIGKRYYVSLKSIRELNQLSQDEIAAGEKILVVKEMS